MWYFYPKRGVKCGNFFFVNFQKKKNENKYISNESWNEYEKMTIHFFFLLAAIFALLVKKKSEILLFLDISNLKI
jgi:hypothetical protein